MVVWILILFFEHNYAGGATSVEFSSQIACEQAAAAVHERGYADVAMCVQK